MLESLEEKGLIKILRLNLIPEGRDKKSVEKLFEHYCKVWKNETSHSRSNTFIFSHKAYLQIIDLGRDVLPYIFRDLEKNGGLWYSALETITGANPVLNDDSGINIMKEKWLEWAEERNLRYK